MSTTRVKDTGFLQKNIEKLILAAGALVLVLALFLFVFLNPFKVELGGKPYDSPQDAIDRLKAEDNKIKTGLASQSPLPETEPPNFLQNIQDMIGAPVNSPEPVERLTLGGLTTDSMNPPLVDPPQYVMVYPPTPEDVDFSFGTDVLDAEFDPAIVNQFFELWGGPREPADFSMIIAAGNFDIWEWANRLKAEDEDADTPKDNQIPIGIWSRRLGIAGVALLREEQDENGQWINRQYVSALPGQSRVLPMDVAPTQPFEALQNIELMRQAQSDISRPELPWLTGLVQAAPPGGENFLNGENGFTLGIEGELGQAEQQIKDLEEKIKELEARRQAELDRRRDRGDRPDRQRDEFDDGGFDEGGGLEEGGSGRPRTRPDRERRERRDPIQRRIDGLREKIERLQPQAQREREKRKQDEERRRTAEERRRASEALRRERDGTAGFGDEFGGAGGLGFEGVQIQEGSKVRVWAADPTMRPGKTYRYKLVVAVINPLYGVPRLESEQLAENQARAAIFPTAEEIEAMDWIGPVTVEPEAQFFFTSGSENRASLDIYRRHEGLMYKHRFDVSPGDPIGGTITIKNRDDEFEEPKDIDMGIGTVLIDITRRRDTTGAQVLTMIYMDEAGNLFERSQTEDTNNPAKRIVDKIVKDGPDWPLRPDEDADNFNGGEFEGGGEFGEFDEFEGF